jgi:hypothetical protein
MGNCITLLEPPRSSSRNKMYRSPRPNHPRQHSRYDLSYPPRRSVRYVVVDAGSRDRRGGGYEPRSSATAHTRSSEQRHTGSSQWTTLHRYSRNVPQNSISERRGRSMSSLEFQYIRPRPRYNNALYRDDVASRGDSPAPSRIAPRRDSSVPPAKARREEEEIERLRNEQNARIASRPKRVRFTHLPRS